MPLTPKQFRFVEEYILDLNATQAAIRAGYAKSGARTEGARLLAGADIAKAVEAAKRERNDRSKTDADWVLYRLRDELEADLRDLFGDNGELLAVDDWPLIWRTGLIVGIEVEEQEVAGKSVGVVRRFKLSDRVRRLELLGKHTSVQAFEEKLEMTLGDPAERKAREAAKFLAAQRAVN